MRKGIIYRAISPVGKSYIGQTTSSLTKRKAVHLSHSRNRDTHFYRAIRKYGFTSFEWQVLYTNVLVESLDKLEQETIVEFNSYHCGYNSTLGGNSNNSGFRHSKTTKERMSIAAKQRKIHSRTGCSVSNDTKVKISVALQGRSKSQTHRQHISRGLCKSCWQITTPTNEVYLARNLNRFCRDKKLNSGHMYAVARGVKSAYKGYRCRRVEEIDVKSLCGKLEYWKLDCYEEQVRFINGPEG